PPPTAGAFGPTPGGQSTRAGRSGATVCACAEPHSVASITKVSASARGIERSFDIVVRDKRAVTVRCSAYRGAAEPEQSSFCIVAIMTAAQRCASHRRFRPPHERTLETLNERITSWVCLPETYKRWTICSS